MEFKLKAYSIWEFGTRKDAEGRPHQEDSIFPAHGSESDSDRLFILCDGMGGHDSGEVASATVCQAMSESVINDGHDKEGVFTDQDLRNAVAAAFDALDLADTGAEKKMGTTMTFLKLHRDGATVAHMGDSRVYHIRPGKTGEETRILFQTTDHSLINDLLKIGEITPEEAAVSTKKNVITRAMQPHSLPRPKADIHHITDIRPGDYFYMCSDGMLEQDDMESGESLRNIFSLQGGDDRKKLTILKGATDENHDNHTAIIVHITDVEGAPAVPPQQPAPAPRPAAAPSAAPAAAPMPNMKMPEMPKRKSGSMVYWFLGAALIVAGSLFAYTKCSSDKETVEVETEEPMGAVPAPEEGVGNTIAPPSRQRGNDSYEAPNRPRRERSEAEAKEREAQKQQPQAAPETPEKPEAQSAAAEAAAAQEAQKPAPKPLTKPLTKPVPDNTESD